MSYITSVTFVLLTIVLYEGSATEENWIPVFVAFSENNGSVYDAWRDQKECDFVPTNLTSASRDRHLRNPLIDTWSKQNIKKVKMELYREDCMMAWLIFDGRRTNWLDWFGQYKLLDSSFEDLKENKEFEFFSMVEMDSSAFAIQREYKHCTEDFGWFIVLDSDVSCSWTIQKAYPLIMFTRNGTPRNWNNDARKVDHMVVYVLKG